MQSSHTDKHTEYLAMISNGSKITYEQFYQALKDGQKGFPNRIGKELGLGYHEFIFYTMARLLLGINIQLEPSPKEKLAFYLADCDGIGFHKLGPYERDKYLDKAKQYLDVAGVL